MAGLACFRPLMTNVRPQKLHWLHIEFTPKAAKPPATYSQAVKTAGLVLANIRAILEAAGSSLEKVASVTVVLADEEDFPGMNEGMAQVVPFDLPARQGAKLPVRILGLKVSIGAIAAA
jgi:2-iminobutanoate/2-iminopropanoate deaminase